MEQLPCLKDKCILLPVCKNKHFIRCDKLYNYYNHLYNKYTDIIILYERDYIFLLISKKLKKIPLKDSWLSDDKDSFTYYINYSDWDINNNITQKLSEYKRQELNKLITEEF